MSLDLQDVYNKAIKAHEKGNVAQAVQLYATLLSVHPDADIVLYNQGIALYELNRFDEAVENFALITKITEADADTWFNLGLCLKECGKFEQAIKAYKCSLALQLDVDTLFNLANCCRESGDIETAFASYKDVLKINPEHTSAINNYAYLAHREGDYPLAKKLYQQLLKLQPHHTGASHMLAALTGKETNTPDKTYVRDLFDQYSHSFEESLVTKLNYRVPELLFSCLCEHFPNTVFNQAVDLGCGTGLAGVLFSPICSKLTGVDLSSEMIKNAAEKKLYENLIVADVVEYLTEYGHNADLFIAADLVTYLADLSSLFTAIAEAAKRDAVIVFSTEHACTENWEIRPTGRFAHSRDYIKSMLIEIGGRRICVQQEKIRKEGGNWVQGDIYLAVVEGRLCQT